VRDARPEMRRRKRPLRPMALAMVALLIALLAFLVFRAMEIDWLPRHDRAAPEIIGQQRVVTREHQLYRAVFLGETLGYRQGFRRRFVLAPPYLPLDVRVITSGDVRIQIADVEAPSLSAVCPNEDGSLAACGLEARAAGYQVYRLETLVCESAAFAEQSAQPLLSTCTFRGRDLAVELVRAGVARPSGLASKAMREAEEDARAAKRGLWAQNWRIRQ